MNARLRRHTERRTTSRGWIQADIFTWAKSIFGIDPDREVAFRIPTGSPRDLTLVDTYGPNYRLMHVRQIRDDCRCKVPEAKTILGSDSCSPEWMNMPRSTRSGSKSLDRGDLVI